MKKKQNMLVHAQDPGAGEADITTWEVQGSQNYMVRSSLQTLLPQTPTSIELQLSTAELFYNYANRSQMHRIQIQIQIYQNKTKSKQNKGENVSEHVMKNIILKGD